MRVLTRDVYAPTPREPRRAVCTRGEHRYREPFPGERGRGAGRRRGGRICGTARGTLGADAVAIDVHRQGVRRGWWPHELRAGQPSKSSNRVHTNRRAGGTTLVGCRAAGARSNAHENRAPRHLVRDSQDSRFPAPVQPVESTLAIQAATGGALDEGGVEELVQ